MKTFLIVFFILCYTVCVAGERTDVYDKNWNRTGYKVKEKDRTVVYDKNWNRKGYEKDNKRYDKDWNRVKEYK